MKPIRLLITCLGVSFAHSFAAAAQKPDIVSIGDTSTLQPKAK